MANYYLLLLCIISSLVWAHGSDTHQAEISPPVSQNSPFEASKRDGDARVFMPKSVQRYVALRTQIATKHTVPQMMTLNGRVIANTNASARVQSIQNGRLEASSQGWPHMGQRVRKGQILAYLQPSLTALEQAQRAALLAELAAQEKVLAQRLYALQQTKDSVPAQDIKQATIEISALKQRQQALQQTLQKEPLFAPITGVISLAEVRIGQVVEAKDILFEIVDASRLWLEVQAFDSRLAQDMKRAYIALPQQQLITLQYLGAGNMLTEQAMPLLFQIQAHAPVVLGQRVTVQIERQQQQQGIVIPTQAIVGQNNHQAAVWLHQAPEHFVLQAIDFIPLDAKRVLVTKGLSEGQRVVVQGVLALSQVR